MTEVSLQDLMRDMAKRMDALDDVTCSDNNHEIDAYISLDPVLGDLHRQYLEAKANYKGLAQLRGKDDPMAEAAQDWLDSADCAVQTRMIELHQNLEIRKQAEGILKRNVADEQIERNKTAASKYKCQTEKSQKQRQLMAEAARKDGEDSFFVMVFLIWMLQSVTARVRRSLSLANSFMMAAVVEKEKEYYKAVS